MDSALNFLTIESYEAETYQELFDKIAENILNNTVLVVTSENAAQTFRIAEIEFYLKDGTHNDPFIHGDEHQTTPGKWYFHRQNGGKYKSGSYKGLDITFGYSNPGSKCYGGILIRSICGINSENIIEGPCLVVNNILKCAGCETIYDLVDNTDTIGVDHDTLKLVVCNDLPKRSICRGPRVGLTLKQYSKEKEGFIMNNYRYTTYIRQLRKLRAGMILVLAEEDDIEEIYKKTGVFRSHIRRYLECAKIGGSIADFKGTVFKVNDICSLYEICEKKNIKLAS